MIGHCSLHLNWFEKANKNYQRVLCSYNRPDDVHLIYIRNAMVLESLDKAYESKKMLLLSCKYSPTPYTWLGAGMIYFKQRDFISAEECLSQANILDNRLPEIWAHLALTNIELGKECEAQLCYRQAVKVINFLLKFLLYIQLSE